MTDQLVVQIVKDAFYYLFLIVGPILLISLVVGLIISVFQAATSISEQTLTFVPKLVVVLLLTLILLPWLLNNMKEFAMHMFNMIPTIK